MNPPQRERALRDFFGYLHHDWVELEVAVQCANECVGHDDLQMVTPEACAFVASLIEDEGLAVGALDEASRFSPWTGSKEEWKRRLLDMLRIGERVPRFQAVWFDRPKEEPIQPPQHNARSRPPSGDSPASATPSVSAPRG